MNEKIYTITAMLDGDHSKWRTFTVRAKNEESARAKADKHLSKLAKTWEIDSIEII